MGECGSCDRKNDKTQFLLQDSTKSKRLHDYKARPFEKSPLDLLIQGSDNFTTTEPYFGGLNFYVLCDNFYYMTLNIC